MKTLRATAILGLSLLSAACSYLPTVPSPFTSPGTQVLEGKVYPSGTTTVWLTTTQAGTLSLTLTRVEPGPILLGLGFGVLGSERAHCDLSVQVDAQASSTPQITAVTPAGTYCVEVSDVGSVTLSGTSFSVSVLFQ